MNEGLTEAVLFICAIAGTLMLTIIANQLEKIAKAIERIANRDR